MAKCPVCREDGAEILGPVMGRVDVTAYRCPRCGNFAIDGLTALGLGPEHQTDYHLLCAVLRRSSDAGRITQVTDANIDALVASAPAWTSLFDGVDRLMLLLASRADRFMTPIKWNKDLDYPLIAARGEREMNELLVFAGEMGLLDIRTGRITLEGWKRVDALRLTQPKARRAFVAMWFADEMNDAWVLGFKPGVDDTKYFVAERVDSAEHNDRIDDRIVALIRQSGLVVADFTGNRGGAYFEAGLALGLSIPVVWTCRKDWEAKLHFDTRSYNHIIWETPDELRVRAHRPAERNGCSASAMSAVDAQLCYESCTHSRRRRCELRHVRSGL